jgi:hypothetical protein
MLEGPTKETTMFIELHGRDGDCFILNSDWIEAASCGKDGLTRIETTGGGLITIQEPYADLKAALGTQHVGFPVSP